MSLNKAPKFGKVELLIKSKNKGDIISSLTRLEFDDCGLMITGDYLIVITDEKDELKTSLTSTGQIFHISEISAYKTYSI